MLEFNLFGSGCFGEAGYGRWCAVCLYLSLCVSVCLLMLGSLKRSDVAGCLALLTAELNIYGGLDWPPDADKQDMPYAVMTGHGYTRGCERALPRTQALH